MRARKSQPKEFFLGMYNVLILQDMVWQYGEPTQFARDFATIESRVSEEGFSFLTKTLPSLAKAIDKALVVGRLSPSHAFKRCAKHVYPVFLQVLMRRVFESDGSVKTNPCIAALRDLRQVLYLCYKYEVDYDAKVINNFLDNFEKVDCALPTDVPVGITNQDFYCIDVAHTLLRDLFSGVGDVYGDIIRSSVTPNHGPGAVATGEKNWEKMNFKRFFDKIHQVFPYYEFFFANAMDLAANVKAYKALDKCAMPYSKVQLVPKDSRGPRLICMEPLEFQYVQQGLSKFLTRLIETNSMTAGHVNFSDQNVNRDLALQGSVSGDCVTLDMKEASDRVSYWLVKELFSDTPIWRYLDATRTEGTILPNGDKLPFKKFSPMGSALCFPIESLVHWSVAVASLHVYNEVTLKSAMSAVYVFGDDIIIKGQNHSPLFGTFEQLGMKFNAEKCCTNGFFRESCGMDAFHGECVTPTKVKKRLPRSPKDATAYASYIDYCNNLWSTGYLRTSEYIRLYLEKIYGRIPVVRPNSSVPGLKNIFGTRAPYSQQFKSRYNNALHCIEYYLLGMRACKISRPLDRCEYHRKLMVRSDEFRSGIYSVPRRVKFHRGWCTDLA